MTSYESIFFPFYCFVLVRVGIGEPFDLAGLTAKKTVKIGADLIALAFAEVVTLCAPRLTGESV